MGDFAFRAVVFEDAEGPLARLFFCNWELLAGLTPAFLEAAGLVFLDGIPRKS